MARIGLATLEIAADTYVAEDLRGDRSDLVYRVRCGDGTPWSELLLTADDLCTLLH